MNPWPDLIDHSQPANHSSAPFLYPIEDQQIIHVSGPDSAKFMQGQFTCHLNEINGQTFRRGACCNAKGRMISSFSISQFEDDYLLAMNKGLVDSTLAHLKKYMVFFKTQMTPSNWIMAGLTGPEASSVIKDVLGAAPENDYEQTSCELGLSIKLPFEAGYELWLQPETAKATLDTLISKCTLTTESTWSKNLIQHGLAQLTPETQDSLIPQMMNLGVTGGISFSKGCYTGQEIVARMQYLGKLKRHGYILESQDASLSSGTPVFSPEKASAIGEIVNVAPADGGSLVFAVLEDKYLDGTLFVTPDGSEEQVNLELLSLPYDPIDSSS
jgi:folate-binding protein YgfZ